MNSDASPDPKVEKLSAYVFEVMRSWSPSVIPGADYADVAHSIAVACLEHPSSDPAEDAIVLAALGYFEGARYAAYVDDCRTDDPAWRASEEGRKLTHIGGNSDGGRAHTIFQIHVDGVVFDGQPLSAKRLCEDRTYAAGIALRIARSDPTLCSYSGEDPAGGCPKAEIRVRFATEAIKMHPFRL